MNEMITDEREGLPSASFAPIGSKCHGAWHFIKELPEEKREQVTFDGDDIHEALETGDTDGLSITQMEIAKRIAQVELPEVLAFFGNDVMLGSVTCLREHRLWIHQDGKKVFSAKLDMFCVFGQSAFAVNYKTGFATLGPVEANRQVQAEAACLLANYPNIRELKIGYIAHRLCTKLEFVHIVGVDPRKFVDEFLDSVVAKWTPTAERTAGEHCRWCKGKAYCDKAVAYAKQASTELDLPLGLVKKEDIINKIIGAPLDNIARLYRTKSVVNSILDAIKARLMGLDAETLKSVGLMRKPGRKTVEIKSLEMLRTWAHMTGHLKLSEVDSATSASLSKLSELYAAKTGLSQKDARKTLEEKLVYMLERGQESDTITEYQESKQVKA